MKKQKERGGPSKLGRKGRPQTRQESQQRCNSRKIAQSGGGGALGKEGEQVKWPAKEACIYVEQRGGRRFYVNGAVQRESTGETDREAAGTWLDRRCGRYTSAKKPEIRLKRKSCGNARLGKC